MRKTTVLVVDPEPDLRTALRLRLESEGFAVLDADDFTGAIRRIRDGKPDIMLTGISLPGADGVGLIKQVRLTSGMPIVVLTARPEPWVRRRAEDAGADAFFLKPCSISPVISTMRKLVSQEKKGKLHR
jgi:two-component system KDP operon response regulator KdpE